MRRRPVWGRAAAVVAIGAVVAAGCEPNNMNSGTNGAVTTPAAQHSDSVFNSTDVTFARDYITEQSRAQAASALLAHRADHVQLFIVAAAVERRGPDIKEMRGWLHHWNKPGSTPPPMHHPSGVLTSHDIDEMTHLRGARFDQVWLADMATNDAATIASCENEVMHGLNHLALRLAGLRWGVLRAELAKLQHWRVAWRVHEPHNQLRTSTGPSSMRRQAGRRLIGPTPAPGAMWASCTSTENVSPYERTYCYRFAVSAPTLDPDRSQLHTSPVLRQLLEPEPYSGLPIHGMSRA